MEKAKRNHSFHIFLSYFIAPYLLLPIYNQNTYYFTNQFILATLAAGCLGFPSLNWYLKMKERKENKKGKKVRRKRCTATKTGGLGVGKT